jgi:hypothetical protein
LNDERAIPDQNQGIDFPELVLACLGFPDVDVTKRLVGAKDSILDGFEFTAADIAMKSGLPFQMVRAVITAFSFPENGNPTFMSLNAFNAANAYPILKAEGHKYLVFLPTGLAEALYDTPFYWMCEDRSYLATAMKNRGLFTEEFTAERLGRPSVRR